MGCAASKPVADDSSPSKPAMRARGPRASMVSAGYKTELVNESTPAEAQRPLVATAGSVSLRMPPGVGFAVRYAYVSQRGYYPDAPEKTNQDAVCATERLAGHEDMHLFSVFDGHGELGTECAQFVRDKLPPNVCGAPGFPADPPAALHDALVTANTQLHDAPIDDCLSGTTACAALLAGRTLHVANVGDSRAVLAEQAAAGEAAAGSPGPASAASSSSGEPPRGGLVAVDLSHDQTPFRPDECLRVLKAGARVMTLDQLEGLKDPGLPCWTNEADCDGDPPRLWSPNGLYPGTAFTRSIGDTAAEDIGVIADPELSATQLGPQHPFAVVASDGVWEFISSQRAVDMVAKHDNPYDAAKALVAQAYKLWLQKETRTDDITVIVLFFDWPSHQQQQQAGAGGSGRQHDEEAAALLAAQPLARGTPPQAGEPPGAPGWRSRSGKSAAAGSSDAVGAAC